MRLQVCQNRWPSCSGKQVSTHLLLVGLLMALILSACGGDSDGKSAGPDDADAEPIRLGLLVPITGSWARGLNWNQAAQLAIDEINDSGGVLGRPLELHIANTETVPAIAVDGARELMDAGVVAIIGPGTSSATIEVAHQVTIAAGVPLISPSATSPLIAELDDEGLVSRTAASDAFQGSLSAQWAVENGFRTAGILHVGNAYGTGLADAFRARFESLGGTITDAVAYPDLSGEAIVSFDYNGVVERVFAGSPQLVYLITYDSDGAKITVAASQQLVDGQSITFLGCDANASMTFLENSAPEIVEGMIGTLPSAPAGSAVYAGFSERYQAAFGVEPQAYDETTYDAVYLAALALQQAGAVGSAELADNLQAVSAGGVAVEPGGFSMARELLLRGEDIDYRGAAGEVDLDDNGDVSSGTFQIWKVVGGAFTTLETTAFP